MMFGQLPHKEKGKLTGEYSVRYDRSKYQFMLNAPFECTKMCCNLSKKTPFKKYERETGRKAITGQMADESKLREQNWIKNGCNGFYMAHPISNPLSFWKNDDILEYIRRYNIPICSVYGDIVEDIDDTEKVEGQLSLFDCEACKDWFGKDYKSTKLKTTGCERTGCCMCGYGIQQEKRPNRLEVMAEVTNPKLRDYILQGGAFDDDGLWKPDNRGLGFWFVYQWINVHGGFDIYIPDYEKYEKEYGNELTRKYLEKNNGYKTSTTRCYRNWWGKDKKVL